MRHLLALPAELLAAILSHLAPRDLLSCAASARHLSRLIADSSRLQYTISLSKHRLLDVLPASHNPPYATRLKVLRDREQAWRDLQWRGRHTLQLPPTGSVYEFVGGIYGNGREDENRVTASISFLELPTSRPDADTDHDCGRTGGPLRTWTHAMGDVAIIDFTMDPSQNLLVLVALAPPDSKCIYNLHLRTISTNQPHPKAPLPILSCLERHPTIPPPPELFAAVRVQVSGDLVGLLIKEAPDPVGAHLQIWNWEHDPYYPCSMSSQHGIDDFTFLSRSSFLIVLPVGRFEVYTFPDPLTSPTPLLSRANQPPSSTKNGCHPIRQYSYDFPELSNGYMYWYISMSCNPAPGYVPSQRGRAMNPFPPSDSTSSFGNTDDGNNGNNINGAAKQLYYPLPDERIHACCIYIFNPNNHTHIAANNMVNNGNNLNTTRTNNHSIDGANLTNHHLTTMGNISANGSAHSTATINGNNATMNVNHANFLTDDDLDDENQQVHSFVFFLNLKTLLEPPKEWFHYATSSTPSNSSPFAALASKLGPLWKSSSSIPSSPSTSRYFSPNHNHGENSSAISLESSLNALKRRQEEKELRDAKVILEAVNADAGVNGKEGKKKKRSGGVSSSLSVEIPIGDPIYGGTRSPVLTKSKSLLSSPSSSSMSRIWGSGNASGSGSASGSTSSTYPPFPTFSSPFPSTFSANGSSSGMPLANTGNGNFTFGSTTARDEDTPMTPLEPPSSPEDSPSRTTVFTSGGIGSPIFTQPDSPGPVMTSASLGPGSSVSGSANPSSSFTATSATTASPSASHAASSSKTRSASTPPTYTSSRTYSTPQHRSSFTTSSSPMPLPPPPPPPPPSPSVTSSTQPTRRNRHRKRSYSPHRHSQPIPWEVWGPSSTRWFEECLSTDWQHAIYGLRTVESVSVRERERERMMSRMRSEIEKVNSVGKGKGKQQEREGAGVSANVSVNGKGKGKGKDVGDEKGRERSCDEIETLKGKVRVNGGGEKAKGKVKVISDVLDDDLEATPEDKGSSPEALGHALDQEEEDSDDGLSLERFIMNGSNPDATTSSSSSDATEPSTPIPSSSNGIISPQSTSFGLPPRRRPHRFLRVRDFNPYSLKQAEAEAEAKVQAIAHVNGVHTDSMTSSNMNKGKGKQRALSSPSPPPSSHSYSYPYPIHLHINSNFSYPWLSNSISSFSYSHSVTTSDATSSSSAMITNEDHLWGKRRVVREPSITPVKGVFKKDIVSWLPYTEIMSEETFEVTDVMMDDCRLLLLKRGQMGKLESVEVLMM